MATIAASGAPEPPRWLSAFDPPEPLARSLPGIPPARSFEAAAEDPSLGVEVAAGVGVKATQP